MIDVTGHQLNLKQLRDELAAAGLTVPALGTSQQGNKEELYTYDANGAMIDLPPAAAAIVQAHVAQPLEVDIARGDLQGSVDAAITRLVDVVNNIDTYTPGQIRDAVKDLARVELRLLRYIRVTFLPSGG
jgi:hypothetical protein